MRSVGPPAPVRRNGHHLYSRHAGILLLLYLSLLVPLSVHGRDIAWGGRFKSLYLHLEPAPGGWADGGEISSNNLRLTLKTDLPHNLTLETAVESSLMLAHPAGLAGFAENGRQRAVDLTASWGENHAVSEQLHIDRLCLSGQASHLEWSLGRQAIGFGRILLASPLDVIAPFAPDALDTEIRPGVDALKLRYYIGQTGELGAYAVMGEHADDCSGLATLSWNTRGLDILAITGLLRNRPMVGVGLAGDIGGIGIKMETAAYSGKKVSQPEGDLHRFFAIAALECWYRFGNGLVFTGQYLYNGAGADKPSQYPQALNSAPIREGLSFLLGQHYLLLAPSYELHPLVTLSGLGIVNLQDGSWLLRPALNISLSDNLDLMLFWGFTLGRSAKNLRFPRSEFGARGQTGGLLLTWHF
ncbi:hypothetical protein Pcar_2376 [Syntrophotalea carbinolica DSM 2380]|uniref:Uncharacterized protein n=1 Tax=Syntrophotalea carbinolica (strain DSM 2380 / NBRC 103641 / GraBd1) TaxID=338963 RepID=Q3A1Z2_SYNC1|nr:hypothetical protein [Syntrophotalea carbinolica]ABA89615.1 hypothetical protein Pcar_2376 [Syntrophotalea carbinolica DSM 2380]